MITKEEILQLKHTTFEEADPWNPSNTLKGYLIKEQGRFYGTLILTHINGMQCKEQIVLSAPKMYYPYDKLGRFLFDKVDAIAYEKYDGTCIIGYAYEHRGKIFKTYKTRLTPFTHTGDMYDFIGLWKEMLKEYPQIPSHITMDRTIIFELFGIKNKHLILYDVPLDAVHLFAIDRKTNKILMPPDISDLPLPIIRYRIKSSNDFVSYYKKMQGEIESLNTTTEEGIIGSEGTMIYIEDEELGYKHYKCKPASVLLEHCKPGLNKKSISATVYNAYENFNDADINYEIVKELLLEEFSDREIEWKRPMVLKCIDTVKLDIQLSNGIIKEYDKLGIKLSDDKVTVMRYMADKFGRQKSKYIFTILKALL